MSDKKPLMPKATAVWLVDNTALTFEQIAEFCGLHTLEVKGIADGDVASGIKGMDPVSSGQLTRDEIKQGEGSASHELMLAKPKVEIPEVATKKRGPRYTPVSRRQDRPNAILWLLRNHSELKDAQIGRLAVTTKATINQIRDRSHWNSTNLVPQDPVTLGLCSQTDLDFEVKKAMDRAIKDGKLPPAQAAAAETLLPADETTGATKSPVADADVFSQDTREASRMERESSEAKEAAKMLKQLERLGAEEAAPAEESAETPPAPSPDAENGGEDTSKSGTED